MKKVREYSKAIAALLGAIATFLVSVNAPAEWSVWIGSVVAILTGVATFGIPNVPSIPLPDKSITSLDDIQIKLDETKQATLNNLDEVTRSAVNSITQIQQTLGGAAAQLPGPLGPLASGAIDSFKLPGL